MARRRSRNTAAQVPDVPPSAPAPEWWLGHRKHQGPGWIAHSFANSRQLSQQHLIVPRSRLDSSPDLDWQRDFAQSVFDGVLSTNPIIIQRRHGLAPRIVIDGVQRLAALDVTMTYEDGAEYPRSPLTLDVFTGRVSIGAASGPPRFPLRIVHSGSFPELAAAFDRNDDTLAVAMDCARDALEMPVLLVLEILDLETTNGARI